jgi:hypothetical protein
VKINAKSLYHGHRFPAAVISCAVRWYFRFQLSLRDVEELRFESGVIVSYETVRRWCDQFGACFAQCARAVRRDDTAAKCFFRRVLHSNPVPRKISSRHTKRMPWHMADSNRFTRIVLKLIPTAFIGPYGHGLADYFRETFICQPGSPFVDASVYESSPDLTTVRHQSVTDLIHWM